MFFIDQQAKDEDSDGSTGINHSPQRIMENKRSIFTDIDVSKRFYDQAKSEVSGFNGPSNQESLFYTECINNGVLPIPIFKYI